MDDLGGMDPVLLAPLVVLVVVDLIGRIWALVQCIRARKTNGPRAMWIALILLLSFFGWIGWFIFGRSEA